MRRGAWVHSGRPVVAVASIVGMLAAVLGLTAAPAVARGPEAAPPRLLSVAPGEGPWFTRVTVSGSGCAEPGTELVVIGGLYTRDGEGSRRSPFVAFPLADGSWSRVMVATPGTGTATTGFGPPAPPGDYEMRAECLPMRYELSGPVPGGPPLVTYAAPFTVLPGATAPSIQAPATVTIAAGRADLTVSGDGCAGVPDGPGSGFVELNGPEGADPADPSAIYQAWSFYAASADGTWTVTLRPAVRDQGPLVPKPGTYRLTAVCWLWVGWWENTTSGFDYGPRAVTLIRPDQPSPPTPPAPPRPPIPAPPAQPVPARPAYTG